jgi:Asp-tRNA(Asn)/Glu-tRNA(Gln) amidotransferase A subunit family amidase
VSVPGGFTESEIPVGVELLSKPYEEARLVEMAYAYEQEAEPRRNPETAPRL